jgi:sugar (pentulose or hexulose) kinase
MSDSLGLNLRDVAIGIQGAFSAILVLRKKKLYEVLSTVVVGGLTANYVGPAAADRFGFPHDVTVYICGVAGWVICLGALKWITIYSKLEGTKE